MSPQPPSQLHPRVREHLKSLLILVSFIFSLGVGYQRLEGQIAATENSLKAHESQVEIERQYLKNDLDEIKTKLDDIERYLRSRNK